MTVGKTSRFGTSQVIPMDKIVPSPYQVRVDYGDVEGLARDIEQKGLLQPILVRPIDGGFEIVHGHRRHKAIESLGWKFIDGFCKELTNSEAITIQGSENLWRKNYTPIEEANLYQNYKIFLEKECGTRVSYKQVGEAFRVSEQEVQVKIGLLELPEDIRDKLHKGELPYSKVRKLSILTREKPTTTVVGQFSEAPKTDRFYNEIKQLAEEIEKGSLGGLRTERGVSQAAQSIRDGVEPEEAIKKAKIDEAVDLAQKELRRGKNPEEVLQNIAKHQADPSELLEATIEANIGLLKKMLVEKLILCPYCGKPDLMWGCKKEFVVKQNEETN